MSNWETRADMVERPVFWIIGGPNGSGKSTLYGETKLEEFSKSVWIINPDLLTRRLVAVENIDYMSANPEALDRIMDWIHASLKAHQSVGVETVLSTDKYLPIVDEARRYGHQIVFAYVYLDTPERNIERVAIRVGKGGHDVREDKIRSRRERSLDLMPIFFAKADQAYIFDNSGDSPQTVAEKQGGIVTVYQAATDEIRSRLARVTR